MDSRTACSICLFHALLRTLPQPRGHPEGIRLERQGPREIDWPSRPDHGTNSPNRRFCHMISTLTGGCGVDAVRHRARNGARTRRRWSDVVRLALSERSQSLEFCNRAHQEGRQEDDGRSHRRRGVETPCGPLSAKGAGEPYGLGLIPRGFRSWTMWQVPSFNGWNVATGATWPSSGRG